jgi:adenylate kinase family enzyme
MCGIAGSGKTTYAQALCRSPCLSSHDLAPQLLGAVVDDAKGVEKHGLTVLDVRG